MASVLWKRGLKYLGDHFFHRSSQMNSLAVGHLSYGFWLSDGSNQRTLDERNFLYLAYFKISEMKSNDDFWINASGKKSIHKDRTLQSLNLPWTDKLLRMKYSRRVLSSWASFCVDRLFIEICIWKKFFSINKITTNPSSKIILLSLTDISLFPLFGIIRSF